MKPAKKFVLGAVYALTMPNDWGDEILPAVYAGRPNDYCYAFALTSCGRMRVLGNGDTFHAYRIRARDWDKFSGQFGKRESAGLFAYTLGGRWTPETVQDLEQQKSAEYLLGNDWEPTPCTCGLGNTIEARRHYTSCVLKEGK